MTVKIFLSIYWSVLIGVAMSIYASLRLSNRLLESLSKDSSGSILTLLSMIVGFVGVSVTIILTSNTETINIVKNAKRSFRNLVDVHMITIYAGVSGSILSIFSPVLWHEKYYLSRIASLSWINMTVLTLLLFLRMLSYLRLITMPPESIKPQSTSGDSPKIVVGYTPGNSEPVASSPLSQNETTKTR